MPLTGAGMMPDAVVKAAPTCATVLGVVTMPVGCGMELSSGMLGCEVPPTGSLKVLAPVGRFPCGMTLRAGCMSAVVVEVAAMVAVAAACVTELSSCEPPAVATVCPVLSDPSWLVCSGCGITCRNQSGQHSVGVRKRPQRRT